ncbi:MAG: ExeM/NucH family extracellular endonuclease [Methylococcaceae bacterium]
MTEKQLLKRHPLALAVFAALNFLPVAHAIIPDVVISQVYGGGNNTGATYKNDYVELFNRGGSPVSLNGWSIQYASSTGTGFFSANTPLALPNATLAPGQYFLVQLNGGTTNGANLPTPDASAANPNLSGTAGKVALVNSTTGLACNGSSGQPCSSADLAKIIDLAGYGTANFFEGAGAAPAPGNTTADFRAANGCTDTDNNNADFATGAPLPRNTTSPVSPCGASTPTVNLSVSANTGSEAGTTAITVTATASSAVTGDQTVNLAVTGTGIDADDYTLSNATITITEGSTTGSVTLTVVDDALVEGAETATLTISNPSAGISLGSTATQNIAITDNDSPVVPDLTINDVSQNEGNNGTTTYTFTVSLSAPAGAGGVTFDIATADSTATASADYTSQSLTSQTIPAGESTYTFSVSVNGETTLEPNETFFVNVINVTGANLVDGNGIGTIINDDNGCGDPATKISAVQGSGTSTSLNNQTGTTIEGIVVGDYQGTSSNSLRGFFVQEEDADADDNPATSEGIFVFEGSTTLANVSVGDRVRVTGTPTEFFNMTQLGTLYSVHVCAGNQTIPTAAALTLPVPIVPNGNLTTATDAINAYYETFEGMMVTFPAALKVSEYFELERYGQLLLTQGARIQSFTNAGNPSTKGLINHEIKLAKRQIILDDSNNIQNFYISSFATTNNIPLPYPTGGLSSTNRFRGGDSITNLTGVLHWSFAGQSGTDAWRIRPVEELYDYTFKPVNPRKDASPYAGGTLKVASFNVLNYFTTPDTTSSSSSGPCGPDSIQDCRGADSVAELARQTDKAVTALCGINADIVGLMEIENNATTSLDSLVTAANAVNGCGPYASINTGAIGGDAIKVGLLYKTTTVNPQGSHALLNSSVDTRFIDTKNRPTLAQTFSHTASGEKLTVAVNHLKSKGSDCTDTSFGGVIDADNSDGQGNCNLTRKNAAMALVDWLNSDPTGSSDPDFLIIGDLNSYAKEDPIKAVENGPDDTANTIDDYTNLVKKFGGNAAYSYVFDGQTGYLDHALASKTLLTQVAGTADWHINADEPPSFDYNDTIKDTGEASFEAKPLALPLYEANAYRTSDHDPVVIGLKLGASINIINGTGGQNTLTGTAGDDFITGLGGADNLTGGLGNDEFVYSTIKDRLDTITDFTVGEDKIVLTALLQSLGYQGSNPLADGVVQFVTSGNDTIVYIDADGTAGSTKKLAFIMVLNVSSANLNNAANFIF